MVWNPEASLLLLEQQTDLMLSILLCEDQADLTGRSEVTKLIGMKTIGWNNLTNNLCMPHLETRPENLHSKHFHGKPREGCSHL